MFQLAIDRGAARLCLADTVGHATRSGVRSLVAFARGIVADSGAAVGIDWHGHNDRGLALGNAFAAAAAGADRIHACALGIGERAGNVSMDLLLLNLDRFRMAEGQNLKTLPAYCEAVAAAVGWKIPSSYPLPEHAPLRLAAPLARPAAWPRPRRVAT
jgi:2-isopropylmalate synthase